MEHPDEAWEHYEHLRPLLEQARRAGIRVTLQRGSRKARARRDESPRSGKDAAPEASLAAPRD
jgi:hypothetical protein